MATQLGPAVQISAQDLYTFSTTQQHVLGEKVFSPDGRAFRYVKAGAVALVPGNVLQGPALNAAHVDSTPSAVSAVGDTTITTSAITVTANQYAGGYLVVEKGTTGSGQCLLIKSHPASTAAPCVITLSDPFQVATSGTITIDLIANQYNGVVVTPATATANIVGVAVGAIPAASFGWIATRGIAAVLNGGGVPAATTNVGAGTAGLTRVGIIR